MIFLLFIPCGSHIPGWGLCTFIVKANDDLRQVVKGVMIRWVVGMRYECATFSLTCNGQYAVSCVMSFYSEADVANVCSPQEQFAMQLIMQLIDIWDKAGLVTSTITPYRCCCREHLMFFSLSNSSISPLPLFLFHSLYPFYLNPFLPLATEFLPQNPLQASSKSYLTASLSKSSPRSAASKKTFRRVFCSYL